jgi:putative PIN family toxin of toxin-antitoxin system
MKVVPDTMMWVSYSVSKDGHRHRILSHAARSRVRLITSPYILNELSDVLRQDFGKSPRYVLLACQAILRLAQIVDTPNTSGQRIAADPDDDPVIATGRAAKADIILTADKALLRLGKINDLEIIGLDDFVLRLPPEL